MNKPLDMKTWEETWETLEEHFSEKLPIIMFNILFGFVMLVAD